MMALTVQDGFVQRIADGSGLENDHLKNAGRLERLRLIFQIQILNINIKLYMEHGNVFIARISLFLKPVLC